MKRKQTLTGHAEWITSLSISPNFKTFITGSLDKTIKIWDLNSNKCIKTINLNSPVWGVCFSPTGEYLVSATEDGTVSVHSF